MSGRQAPFEASRLDALMAGSGVDVLLATSRANVRYLGGGHYHHSFERSTEHGDSLYLAILGLPRSDLGTPFLVTTPADVAEHQAGEFWIDDVRPVALGTVSSAEAAAAALLERGLGSAVIGLERSHLPLDAAQTIQQGLSGARFADSLPVLLEMRAVKRPEEQEQMRRAAEITATAIDAAVADRPGTLAQIRRLVASETEARGAAFQFAYCSAGSERVRFPRERPWREGELVQVDSGCEFGGYRSDVCRMASRGAPSSLALDLYSACLDAQRRIAAGLRAGMLGGDLLASARDAIAAQGRSEPGRTVIHGIGLGHHELPDVSHHPEQALEAGNVLSIEVEFAHPELGLVKIEDALAITPTGSDVLGLPFGGLRTVD